MPDGLASIGGRGTSPALATPTWLKSGLPPGRTVGSGTCRVRRATLVIGSSTGRREERALPSLCAILAPCDRHCHGRRPAMRRAVDIGRPALLRDASGPGGGIG